MQQSEEERERGLRFDNAGYFTPEPKASEPTRESVPAREDVCVSIVPNAPVYCLLEHCTYSTYTRYYF